MKKIILIVVAFALVSTLVIWYLVDSEIIFNETNSTIDDAENNQLIEAQTFDENYFNEEEIVEFTKTYIQVLQRLYYINQDDSTDADTISGLVMSMTTEALKDRNNLEKLLLQTEEMQKSKIMGASVTGSVVDLAIKNLIKAHNDYIQFLRGVDESTLDLAEFQYQMSLFQAETKDAYMFMAENTQIFPLTFFSLNDDPNVVGEWRISEQSRQEISIEIEMRFSDIFEEADAAYDQTQTTDVTVLMVRSLEEIIKTNGF